MSKPIINFAYPDDGKEGLSMEIQHVNDGQTEKEHFSPSGGEYTTKCYIEQEILENLVDQFKNLGFIGVQQLVVTGPSGKYYEMEFDTGIRTLLYLVSDDFCVINMFVVDEFELTRFSMKAEMGQV
ncbi:hypothetical protein RND71_006793 [Anisodus tanguticus]|uniref:Uncharacterized protein n=1 Tax=Anisodus tanguticus TaxID=243964 RepID=A0AAE1SWS9_9SOLA|nr:hypothetical protein RND71_006793 [Anisodus tanguticus]